MSERTPHPPDPRFTRLLPAVSGNTVNGLGETVVRRPSPFFWHPPDRQPFGVLQKAVTDHQQQCAAISEVFSPAAPRGPAPAAQASERVERTAADWTRAIKDFALANEADLVGVARLDPLWVYEGYEIPHAWVIVVGVAMDHALLDEAPASFENPASAVEVGRQYNRASRACRALGNWILSQGHPAKAWPGPYASALSMIPAALAAGFGELGKHGSIINRQYGSSFRLSAVTTDLPLVADGPEEFGADEFCLRCQVCSRECPPQAIAAEKQMVRGVLKWYVDFDKCIPYFGEAMGCAICIARCPWSTPGTAPRLAEKMLRRRARRMASAGES